MKVQGSIGTVGRKKYGFTDGIKVFTMALKVSVSCPINFNK
jgi:hypothetical protein